MCCAHAHRSGVVRASRSRWSRRGSWKNSCKRRTECSPCTEPDSLSSARGRLWWSGVALGAPHSQGQHRARRNERGGAPNEPGGLYYAMCRSECREPNVTCLCGGLSYVCRRCGEMGSKAVMGSPLQLGSACASGEAVGEQGAKKPNGTFAAGCALAAEWSRMRAVGPKRPELVPPLGRVCLGTLFTVLCALIGLIWHALDIDYPWLLHSHAVATAPPALGVG